MQTNDDYIRHRMSDMSVSPHKVLSPLEPNTHQQFYARENTNNSYHNYRRPSITDMNNLPLPNSTVVSRRGSIATEYEYPSRSPSPSSFAFPSKRGYDDYGRRDSLPINNQPPSITPHPLYDPYQRRHSIATAESNTPRNNAKYRGKQHYNLYISFYKYTNKGQKDFAFLQQFRNHLILELILHLLAHLNRH